MTSSPAGPGALLAWAAASGVVTTLVPPSRIPVPVRRGIHVSLGVVAAVAVAWGPVLRPTPAMPDVDPPPDVGVALRPPTRLALAGALGALVGLASAAGMSLDAAAERALVRRGVPHPRAWIGLVAAAVTVATGWGDLHAHPSAGDG